MGKKGKQRQVHNCWLQHLHQSQQQPFHTRTDKSLSAPAPSLTRNCEEHDLYTFFSESEEDEEDDYHSAPAPTPAPANINTGIDKPSSLSAPAPKPSRIPVQTSS